MDGAGDIIDFKGQTFLEILLVDYRWIIVCFFLLPMSFLYNLWFYLRNAYIFYMNSAPKAHEKKVQNIQKQVWATWYSNWTEFNVHKYEIHKDSSTVTRFIFPYRIFLYRSSKGSTAKQNV